MLDELDLVDDEQLVFALLSRDLDDSVTVAAELDVDSIDTLPFVTFLSAGGEQGSNGPGLWSVQLTVNVFGDGSTAAWETCRAVYRAIHAWAKPGASSLPNLGHVSRVTDLSKFARVAAVAMQGKQITQYVGTFTLMIRN